MGTLGAQFCRVEGLGQAPEDACEWHWEDPLGEDSSLGEEGAQAATPSSHRGESPPLSTADSHSPQAGLQRKTLSLQVPSSSSAPCKVLTTSLLYFPYRSRPSLPLKGHQRWACSWRIARQLCSEVAVICHKPT